MLLQNRNLVVGNTLVGGDIHNVGAGSHVETDDFVLAAHGTAVNQTTVSVEDTHVVDVHTLVVDDMDILVLSVNLDAVLHEILNTDFDRSCISREGDKVGPITVIVVRAVSADLPQIGGVGIQTGQLVAVTRNIGDGGQVAGERLVIPASSDTGSPVFQASGAGNGNVKNVLSESVLPLAVSMPFFPEGY